MSANLICKTYLRALAYAAERLNTTADCQEFATHYVGAVACRRIMSLSMEFKAWARERAFADLAAA